VRSLVEQGAEIIVNLSSSPFSLHKPADSLRDGGRSARAHQRPIAYCNLIGGNDQLVFDGNSFAVNSAGNVIAQLAGFVKTNESSIYGFPVPQSNFTRAKYRAKYSPRFLSGSAITCRKCTFHAVVVGLSGGMIPLLPQSSQLMRWRGKCHRRFHAESVLVPRQ